MEILIAMMLFMLFGLMFGSMYMLFRNNKVYRFRRELVEEIGEAAKLDLETNPEADWRRRFELFDKVGYDDMMYSLKPVTVESFWSDRDICQMLHTKHPDDTMTDSNGVCAL